MANFSRSLIKFYCAKFCCAATLAVIAVPSSDCQDLGPILYRSWEGLCSISPEEEAKPHCIKVPYEDPSWQPHGNRIVAVEEKGMVFLDSKGRLVNKVLSSSGRPIWSPDGQHIYAINYKLGRAVERWDASGTNRTVLPVKGLEDQQEPSSSKVAFPKILQMISISPNGQHAALLTRDFREMLIADVSDTAFAVRKILPRGFRYLSQSVWLDDEHLLFIGKLNGTRGELWELDVQTGTPIRRGIDGLSLRDSVALAPDGKSVVVTAAKDGEKVSWNLWRYFLETSHNVRLTSESGAEDVQPSWRH